MASEDLRAFCQNAASLQSSEIRVTFFRLLGSFGWFFWELSSGRCWLYFYVGIQKYKYKCKYNCMYKYNYTNQTDQLGCSPQGGAGCRREHQSGATIWRVAFSRRRRSRWQTSQAEGGGRFPLLVWRCRLLIEEGCSQKRTRLSGDIIGRGDCSALWNLH